MNPLDLIPAPYRIMALAAAGVACLAIGAAGAWAVQSFRLDALQARFDGFVAQTKIIGEQAQKEADATKKADQLRKDKADHENANKLSLLRADNQRLRDARSGQDYLPAPTPGARSPETACFDRPKLESAIRSLDGEISEIVGRGDEARVNLDTAKVWAQPSL